MAKASRKTKLTKRLSRAEARVVSYNGYGTELVFDKSKPLTKTEASSAFNWYNNTQEDEDSKQFLLTFLTEMEKPELLKSVSKIDAKLVFGFASIAAWIGRLISLGYEFEDHKEKVKYLYERVEKLIQTFNSIKRESARSKLIEGRTDYHYYSDRVVAALNEIEDAIDILHVGTYDYDFNAYACLKKHRILDFSAKKMALFLESEYEDCFGPYDDPLVIQCKDPKKKLKLLRTVVSDIRDYAEDNREIRAKKVELAPKKDPKTGEPIIKVRKKKIVPVEKKIKDVKYLKEYEDYDIKSVSPEKILGADEVWVFNVRYDMLQVYRAIDDKGFDIKGTTILNFDSEISTGKRCGRLAVKNIEIVRKSTKAALSKHMKTINSVDIAMNGRLNEHCVILKVFN